MVLLQTNARILDESEKEDVISLQRLCSKSAFNPTSTHPPDVSVSLHAEVVLAKTW